MLKSYDELRKIDVSKYCEERDGFKYLNWATCIALLHENGAEEVRFDVIPDESGNSLRCTHVEFADKNGNTNRCYETRIRVVVDDKEWEFQSPVLNGQNPVKDNSMNQLRVWTSMCRAFVKCIAINTGLGFDLWLKEESPAFTKAIPVEEDAPDAAHIKTLKNLGATHKINLDYWIKSEGKTWETLTATDVAQMLLTIKQKYGDS